MAQATILASAQTAATSSDVTVAAGGVATVGMFAAAAIPLAVELGVFADTPGGDVRVGSLNHKTPVLVLSGPGTFRVVRPNIAAHGLNVGAFSET